MTAVDSAREAFPSHLNKKKGVSEQDHHHTSSNNTISTMNGKLEEWTEENVTDEKALEERVKKWV